MSSQELFAGIDREEIRRALPGPGEYAPFGAPRERAWRHRLDAASLTRIHEDAVALLSTPWPEATASAWLAFERAGDRASYEQALHERLRRLHLFAIAAATTDDERFFDAALDGVWLLLEQSSWSGVLHYRIDTEGFRYRLPDVNRPVLDLYAAEVAASLGWVDHLLGHRLDDLEPTLRRRIRAEVEHRCLVPFRTYAVRWDQPTHKLNNWMPWITSNCLAAALTLSSTKQDIEATVEIVVRRLEKFFDAMPQDGSCDEGPGYWWLATGSLMQALEWLVRATSGLTDPTFSHPKLRALVDYLPTTHIAGDWQVNFGDARPHLAESTPMQLVHLAGRRVGSDSVMRFALARHPAGAPGLRTVPPFGLGRTLLALSDSEWRAAIDGERPIAVSPSVYRPDGQQLVVREFPGETRGLYLAAKAGHNGESHNHNDVGTFIVALHGEPVVVDAGVGTYRKETFDPEQRYGVWSMRSASHNVPLIAGIEQAVGSQHRALSVDGGLDGDGGWITMDLAACYPPEAKVKRWERTIRLDRHAGEIHVSDAWDLEEGGTDVRLHFLLRREPEGRPGGMALSDEVDLDFDGEAFVPTTSTTVFDDPAMIQEWGPSLTSLWLSTGRSSHATTTVIRPRRHDT